MKKPALLVVLDGVGLSEEYEGNACKQAHTPLLDKLFSKKNPAFCSLAATGRDVGLPQGQMGNSEVGHLNIGAGRIVDQELTRIDVAIEEGELSENQVLCEAMDQTITAGSTLHFMGLLSDGGVHSTIEHLEALLIMAAKRGVKRIRVHAFLDGRDVLPTSGADYVLRLNEFIAGLVLKNLGLDLRIATICGRYYAMDRDKRWERVKRAWRTLVLPYEPDVSATLANADAVELIHTSYKEGITDEFFEPLALGDDGIKDNDSVVFFNLRPDRARELTQAFLDPEFESYAFIRPFVPQVHFVCMTEYDPAFAELYGAGVAFAKQFPKNTLADYLSHQGLRQLHIAETEKYAHVTFFLNGGIEEAKQGEERILIPSPKVATYDLQPEMSAPEVSSTLAQAILEDKADVYIVNYANGDMVGHTGNMKATIAALEAVDSGLAEVLDALKKKRGVTLITADHGNADCMFAKDGSPWTAHSTARVPLAFIDTSARDDIYALKQEEDARLADIAPTLLDAMELPIPPEFTGRSLLKRMA